MYPMPNTGSVLDISAGSYCPGHKGQQVLVGGLSLFSMIGALPNMGKTTVATGITGMVLVAYPKGVAHAHDTETTMLEDRIEKLILDTMRLPIEGHKVPDSLITSNNLFFTNSVIYDGTDLFDLLKKFGKERLANEPQVDLEMIDDRTGKPFQWWYPIIEFWDSLSGMACRNAVEMQDKAEVGTASMNMHAMRSNSGKSQIVEQLPNFTAKHAIYVLATGQVGAQYQLDPYRPNVRTLRFMNDNVKIKRVPEITSFVTGNCYIITKMSPMMTKGAPEFPYDRNDENEGTDLIELRFTNMRGKFGPSDIPHAIIFSQRDGWLPYMSNYIYLKDNDRYGFVGNNTTYHFALYPEVKVQRTTLRQLFRSDWRLQRTVLFLVEMHWMNTRWDEEKLPEKYRCTPTELYDDIKALGYDWSILLNTRFWHSTIKDGEEMIPYLSTMDLLMMRTGDYHPYWYPVKKKDLVPTKADEGKKEGDTK